MSGIGNLVGLGDTELDAVGSRCEVDEEDEEDEDFIMSGLTIMLTAMDMLQ